MLNYFKIFNRISEIIFLEPKQGGNAIMTMTTQHQPYFKVSVPTRISFSQKKSYMGR